MKPTDSYLDELYFRVPSSFFAGRLDTTESLGTLSFFTPSVSGSVVPEVDILRHRIIGEGNWSERQAQENRCS
jgi:hypothetical protein